MAGTYSREAMDVRRYLVIGHSRTEFAVIVLSRHRWRWVADVWAVVMSVAFDDLSVLEVNYP